MQKKRLKNSKKNIGETWKTWHGKNVKRECSDKENCQEDLWQRNGQTNDITKNTGEEWRKTRDNGRVRNL